MEVRRIAFHPNNLGMLDFSKANLNLGVAVKEGTGRWLQLDEADLRILYLLLTKDLGDGSAASQSEALGLLAEWCEAAGKWCQKHPDRMLDMGDTP